MSYDTALTVFSPDGRLLQVEHAHQAVERGTAAIAAKCDDCIVIAIQKKQTAQLQDPRTIKKIYKLDEHITAAFAGLTADARVLVNIARRDCQSYRLTFEDAPSVERVAKSTAQVLQKHTQSGGVRPFGVSLIMTGFDPEGPRIFMAEPSGVYSEWIAVAIGNHCKTLQELLEKAWKDAPPTNEEQLVALVKEVMGEVVETSDDNLNFVVIRKPVPE
eukprot:gnl/Dysnectes_brevis/1608_a1822_3272.p1 GENE.gnl/Dysnectes_brevis/1608_a1822_3272~~gnl/Dysnectes_brevis/1608_a1822_3272.p1  ORF type:complete len:217 (+),score=36.96 gnl/Dysnectes_brevis/1608_a1822_3272:21-671(+)